LEEIVEAVAQAVYERAEGGRSHTQLAIELGIEQWIAGYLIRGRDRGQTLLMVILADPQWLRELLAGISVSFRGSQGRNGKGRPS
jgi:hypothetical protein